MIPKTELNKRARKARKEAGLVEIRVWVTPKQREQINKILNKS